MHPHDFITLANWANRYDENDRPDGQTDNTPTVEHDPLTDDS